MVEAAVVQSLRVRDGANFGIILVPAHQHD
jgi:hypothetical protein